MSGGINKLAEQASAVLAADLQFSFERGVNLGKSPIEVLFYQALRVLVRLEHPSPDRAWLVPFLEGDQFKAFAIEYLDICVGDQIRCLDWPVDYVVGVRSADERLHYAVVECDGHDFHERTKEQAARDRSRDRRLQEAGYRVFRFTGAELYRDPLGCAREIFDWAVARWNEGLPA